MNEKIVFTLSRKKNYLSHNNIVQQAPSGIEISGGGGSKANVPSVEGMDISGTTPCKFPFIVNTIYSVDVRRVLSYRQLLIVFVV